MIVLDFRFFGYKLFFGCDIVMLEGIRGKGCASWEGNGVLDF